MSVNPFPNQLKPKKMHCTCVGCVSFKMQQTQSITYITMTIGHSIAYKDLLIPSAWDTEVIITLFLSKQNVLGKPVVAERTQSRTQESTLNSVLLSVSYTNLERTFLKNECTCYGLRSRIDWMIEIIHVNLTTSNADLAFTISIHKFAHSVSVGYRS